MEQILEDAQRAGLVEQVGGTYLWLIGAALGARRYNVAEDRLAKGVEYCSDHGLELFRLYLLSHRARLYLDQGRWAQAAETADVVLRIPRTSISPRITALTVLGLVRARRGDPGHRVLLDEAWDLARPTGEVDRLGPVAAARAEAAWLGCDPDGVASVTELALALVLRCGSALWERHGSPSHDLADELVYGGAVPAWARRSRPCQVRPMVSSSPAAGMRPGSCGSRPGAPTRPLSAWPMPTTKPGRELALDELLALEARPAAAIVAKRLRDRGVMSLPRGPRHDPPEPVRAHCPRGGGPGVIERGLAEQPDCRPARGLREDSRAPRRSYPPQARGKDPRRRAGHRHLARESCRRNLSWGRTGKGCPLSVPGCQSSVIR